MTNALDAYVMRLAAEYSQKSVLANKFILSFLDLTSVKTLPLFAVLWLLWFAKRLQARRAVIEAYLGMCGALVISRIIQDLAPERPRPLHSGDPNFLLPIGSDGSVLTNWSSFPSDTTAFVFALSTAVWRKSPLLGAACYLWSTFVVCLPRIYAGYHYATDILGGAAIGIGVTLLVAHLMPAQARLTSWIAAIEERYTAAFYMLFFVVSYQFMTLFYDVRITGLFLYHHLMGSR